MGSRWVQTRARPKRDSKRRAAAVVEMAVVTPLLLTMIFGIIEFGWVFMVQETLTNAAREACRVGIIQGSTSSDIETRFLDAVAPTGVTVTPDMLSITESQPTGQEYTLVTVTASVPYANVSLVGGYLGLSRATLFAGCSMRKEGT